MMTGSSNDERSKALGRRGEEVASEYLQELGWTIVERNWRCSAGELDIVARDGRTLVFCEVKARRALGYGTPLEAVTRTKHRKLRELVQYWLSERRHAGPIRLDVIGVLLRPGRRPEISHVRGVGE